MKIVKSSIAIYNTAQAIYMRRKHFIFIVSYCNGTFDDFPGSNNKTRTMTYETHLPFQHIKIRLQWNFFISASEIKGKQFFSLVFFRLLGFQFLFNFGVSYNIVELGYWKNTILINLRHEL